MSKSSVASAIRSTRNIFAVVLIARLEVHMSEKLDFTIIVDTKEQNPLPHMGKHVRKALKTGDYSVIGPDGTDYSTQIALERKHPGDLYGSLFGGHERFRKELESSMELEYFAIIVECSYSDCKNKRFEGSEHHKQNGASLIQMLWTLKLRYGIDFIFTNGRYETTTVLKDVFNAYLKSKERKSVFCRKVIPAAEASVPDVEKQLE